MGRELMRVALDFNWPVGVLWKGFLNPYWPTACPECRQTGLNEATKKLKEEWYSFDKSDYVWTDCSRSRRYNNLAWQYHLTDVEVDALWRRGRLRDFKEKPTADQVNEWSRSGFGHDSINQWICVKARAEHLGVYGKCPLCNGTGNLWAEDKYEDLWNNWERINPPEGEGYQMWETVTEGSPISPVFKTPEELAQWLSASNASTLGFNTTSYENWLHMIINSGYAPTMVMNKNGLQSGVDALNEKGE